MHPALLGEWNPPEKVVPTKGKTFVPAKRTARAKACLSHSHHGGISGKLARDFSRILSYSKCERSERFQPLKNSKSI